MSACAVHDFEPVRSMAAVYRCKVCGGFAYKPKARRANGAAGPARIGGVSLEWGTNEMTMFKCHVKGCGHPVVVLFPEVRARRTKRPSCAHHRPDASRIRGENTPTN